jgi:hypothetical protein
MVRNWTKNTILIQTNQIHTCITSCSSKECPMWEYEICIPTYFGYICNLVFGGHLIFMNTPQKKNQTEGILWLLVGVSSLLALRSN